jgi:2-polyprenyl-3-methyl-5-hydroxy-6-metoxy-1,4-benzoquinol methylase
MPRILDKSDIRVRTRTLFADVRGLAAHRQWLRIQICPFEKLLPHVPVGSTLLDIGCGGGLFLGLLALGDPTLNATGVDASSDAINCAISMANKLRLSGLKFYCAHSIETWPAERYTVVSLIDVLHHILPTDRETFFNEAAKRVARGGTLICKEMRPKPRWKAAASVLHDLVVARQWIRHSTAESIESWAAKARLRLIRHEEWDRLWYAHGFWVFRREA